ncbi:uncharacterized protein BDR25DRAFT_123563 [Lindgomyces ingoldianus]|uniref:Uncharacterized protein n=1 Tax=Lindgomyces ingoldianus TaxID=673940 RepID=A0ACB6Q767_9PLEO|nr:uncharacterized protein BDR25DRAFT_123563 [Lindgomyces ingoldianus]KAF2462678.1 hypothetical protein BDR25DRAFT_123563 [Lindgomyces ingoldianus]
MWHDNTRTRLSVAVGPDAIDDVVAQCCCTNMKGPPHITLSESRNKVMQQTMLDDRLEAWQLQGLPDLSASMSRPASKVRAANERARRMPALAYRAVNQVRPGKRRSRRAEVSRMLGVRSSKRNLKGGALMMRCESTA